MHPKRAKKSQSQFRIKVRNPDRPPWDYGSHDASGPKLQRISLPWCTEWSPARQSKLQRQNPHCWLTNWHGVPSATRGGIFSKPKFKPDKD